MSVPGLEASLASLRANRQHYLLAARISRSLGQVPRIIPSRTSLAIEAAASKLIVIAAAVCIAAIATTLVAKQPSTGATSVMSAAMEGHLPSAQDVYATMTGLRPDEDAHP